MGKKKEEKVGRWTLFLCVSHGFFIWDISVVWCGCLNQKRDLGGQDGVEGDQHRHLSH